MIKIHNIYPWKSYLDAFPVYEHLAGFHTAYGSLHLQVVTVLHGDLPRVELQHPLRIKASCQTYLVCQEAKNVTTQGLMCNRFSAINDIPLTRNINSWPDTK